MTDHSPADENTNDDPIKAILNDVQLEILRQTLLWGVKKHHPAQWSSILMEEVGEVAQAVNKADLENLRIELIQTAAVCVNALHALQVFDYTDEPELDDQSVRQLVPELQARPIAYTAVKASEGGLIHIQHPNNQIRTLCKKKVLHQADADATCSVCLSAWQEIEALQ